MSSIEFPYLGYVPPNWRSGSQSLWFTVGAEDQPLESNVQTDLKSMKKPELQPNSTPNIVSNQKPPLTFFLTHTKKEADTPSKK
jgi:hypothetical protein